jgi:hypothetical protein
MKQVSKKVGVSLYQILPAGYCMPTLCLNSGQHYITLVSVVPTARHTLPDNLARGITRVLDMKRRQIEKYDKTHSI